MASTAGKRGRADIGFNMTPMIDCTFQLIIFFMLTTQAASEDYVRMKLPRPPDVPQEKADKNPKTVHVVVNVVPYSDREIAADRTGTLKGEPQFFKLRGRKYGLEDLGELVTDLKIIKQDADSEDKEVIVELRADRRIAYGHIEPVLDALKQAKIGQMDLVVEPQSEG